MTQGQLTLIFSVDYVGSYTAKKSISNLKKSLKRRNE